MRNVKSVLTSRVCDLIMQKMTKLAYVSRYMDWIFSKYSLEHKDDVKCLLMKSLIETLKMDSELSKLKEFSVVSTNIYVKKKSITCCFCQSNDKY